MFDNAHPGTERPLRRAPRPRVGPEDERIGFRCNAKELRLVDAFVASGEFRNRSELVRAAVHAFLQTRSLAETFAAATPDPTGVVEVPVRLRPEEVERYSAYGRLVANGQALQDTLAELVRRGDLELKITDLVEQARNSVHRAVQARARLNGLEDSGRELTRKGVVGR